jgi:hypothetical protein
MKLGKWHKKRRSCKLYSALKRARMKLGKWRKKRRGCKLMQPDSRRKKRSSGKLG